MVYVGLPVWATGYAPKNSVRGTSDKLRVLVVNAEADGRVERTMDFPTQSLNRLDLRLAADGKLLVLAGDKLIRIGDDGERSAQLDIPNEEKEFEIWDVESSTTGGTLRVRLNNTHTMMVDSKTLTVVKQCRDAKDTSDEGTMTDDMELSSQVKTGLPNITYRMERQRFCEKREPLEKFDEIGFVPAVVNDEQFLAVSDRTIALRNLSGETIWTSSAPAGLMLDSSEGDQELSRSGSRAAVRLLRQVQRQEPDTMNPEDIRNGTWRRTSILKVEDSVAIWDVKTGRLVGQVSLKGKMESRFYEPNAQIALSPDGRLLAVLEEGVLTVWKID